MPEKKIRVLIAKPGLDGHDRGAKIIARALRTPAWKSFTPGLRQTPEMIASAAEQERRRRHRPFYSFRRSQHHLFRADGPAPRQGNDRRRRTCRRYHPRSRHSRP